ncbi:MAG TPA: cupin domain-containing protein [Burkholderiales bacterium]|nr:cupin domain-containing protein [Burkholderiales bacterium]
MISPSRKLFLVAAIFGACLALPAQAQESSARKELKRIDMAEAPNMEIISSITEYKPGDELPRHMHNGTEMGYVVQGSTIQVPGKDPMMLATGAPLQNLRGVPHGGFKIVGPTSLVLFTVHIVDKGKPLYDTAK